MHKIHIMTDKRLIIVAAKYNTNIHHYLIGLATAEKTDNIC